MCLRSHLFLPVIPDGLIKDVNSHHKYPYSSKGTGIVTFFLYFWNNALPKQLDSGNMESTN